MGEQGADGHKWVQYSGVLTSNGYIHISQITDEGKSDTGAWELAGICSGMPLDIAKLLLKYAVIDCDQISKKEVKCCREEQK